MKLTVITLTILTFLVIPFMPAPDATSSEIAIWKSEVQDNFQGVTSEYDFRSWSPPFDELIGDVVDGFKDVLDTANNYYQALTSFFGNSTSSTFEDEFGTARFDELKVLGYSGYSTYQLYLELTASEEAWILDNYGLNSLTELDLGFFYEGIFYIIYIDPITDEWFWFTTSPSVYDWIIYFS